MSLNIQLGKRVMLTAAGTQFAVVLHNIKNEDQLLAEIQIAQGTGPISGGPKTKQMDSTRFLLPITRPSFHLEETGVFKFERFEKKLSFFIMNVDHIDPHGKEASITICASPAF